MFHLTGWAGVLMSGHTESPGTWMHACSRLSIMHLIFVLYERVLVMACMCISGKEGKFTVDLTSQHAYFELQLEFPVTDLPKHLYGHKCVFSAATAAVECDTDGVCVDAHPVV